MVGDWLAEDDSGTLVRLERSSLLVRRAVSAKAEPQLMAANVDVVLVTWGMDTQVSSGRCRDMLVLARDSGARPVLVLSKVDVGTGVDELLAELDGFLDGVEVMTSSAVTGEGFDRLRELTTDCTIVLLGSSGAGKSTLTNLLLGVEAQETGDVGRSGEGRHTTTSRELLPLPGGGAIIDSPGIRAATVWEDEEDDTKEVVSRFPDLDELAEECRFSDCTHRGAPAVRSTEPCPTGSSPRHARPSTWSSSKIAPLWSRPDRPPAACGTASRTAATAPEPPSWTAHEEGRLRSRD